MGSRIEIRLEEISLKERKLDLYIPKAASVQQAYRTAQPPALLPYWARLWPAALALSEFLIAHPHYIKAKRVLELAAGLGLPSIVAAQYAATVCCSDYSREAVSLIEASVKYNKLTNVECTVIDWNNLPPDISAEVLLLSDINYEPGQFGHLYKVLCHFLSKGTTIILATPQRLMAKPFIASLLPYVIVQTVMNAPPAEEAISLFVLQAEKHSLVKKL